MVTTFEQALEKVGTDKEKWFFFNRQHHDLLDVDDIAYKKLKIITRAINTDENTGKLWSANWLNGNQRKYSIAFMVRENKSKDKEIKLTFWHYGNRTCNSIVGNHLALESIDKVWYAQNHFRSEIQDFITPTLLDKIK